MSLVVAAACCACAPPSPEELVRQRIAEAESAAEAGESGILAKMVSERFAGPEGTGKAELVTLLRMQVDPRRPLHLLTKIVSVRQNGPESVGAVVIVAGARTPELSPGQLAGPDADLVRFDLEFAPEGRLDWRLVRASWRDAGPSDFF